MAETTTLGAEFVHALVAKNFAALLAVLQSDVDFRALTPRRTWEASDPEGVIEILEQWFDEDDAIEALEDLQTDGFADRERVSYVLRVRNADGLHRVGQQAYFSATDDCISWMRMMCSGYRPVS